VSRESKKIRGSRFQSEKNVFIRRGVKKRATGGGRPYCRERRKFPAVIVTLQFPSWLWCCRPYCHCLNSSISFIVNPVNLEINSTGMESSSMERAVSRLPSVSNKVILTNI
jgi:hypothetical protein